MNEHLNGDQIAAWMSGTGGEFAGRHLEACDACRNEVKEMKSAFSAYRDLIHASAGRDDAFWNRQQVAITERLSKRRWYPRLQWVWVAAMAIILVTAVIVVRAPKTAQNVATDEADKVLLQDVQGALAVDVPEALAPAVLIADERNEILTGKTSWKTKTTRQEGRGFK